MDRNNLGRFSVTVVMIADNPDLVAQIFALLKIVPVKIEWKFQNKSVEYTAIGEQFELIKPGGIVPVYELKMEVSNIDGVKTIETVEFVKLATI